MHGNQVLDNVEHEVAVNTSSFGKVDSPQKHGSCTVFHGGKDPSPLDNMGNGNEMHGIVMNAPEHQALYGAEDKE